MFYVENSFHFLIFSEIVVFFTNLIMNIIILFFASCFGVKKLKSFRKPVINEQPPDEEPSKDKGKEEKNDEKEEKIEEEKKEDDLIPLRINQGTLEVVTE